MTIPFQKNNDTISILVGNKWYQATPEHPNYLKILSNLEGSARHMLKLLDVGSELEDFATGKISVENGVVFYKGEEVHNAVTKRMLEFMKQGLPYKPLAKFLNNLMKNPSFQSRKELYDFLQHKDLPITEDGHFLAYKAVAEDWMDKYSGTMSNAIGSVVKVARRDVDDDRDVGCSHGLHCGALDYVKDYSNGTTDRLLVVKVNPKDCVSVPKDCSFMKLRTCKYEVISELDEELKESLYKAKAEELEAIESARLAMLEAYDFDLSEYDEDYDDEGNPCGDCDCDGSCEFLCEDVCGDSCATSCCDADSDTEETSEGDTEAPEAPVEKEGIGSIIKRLFSRN
jgi:hypothetical protein